MNYWHTQMQPDDKLSVQTLIEVIKTKEAIGLGETWNDKNGNPVPDPGIFKNDIEIGDIVMVRDTITPVALVKILGDAYIDKTADYNFDWFTLRRKVELIAIFDESRDSNLLERSLKKYESKHIQAPGTLTLCQGNNATNYFIKQWHIQAKNDNLMEHIKPTLERQRDIINLWLKFKESYSVEQISTINKDIDILLKSWNQYKLKIVDGSFTIDDYTNRLYNESATMPGGYLCNFLERTTKYIFGSSKPGNAINFGVKLNDDDTYTIGKSNPNASREEAEIEFNNSIKPLITSIVNSKYIIEKITLVDNCGYAAKQILRKMAVLDEVNSFVYIYSDDWIDTLYDMFIEGDEVTNFGKNHAIKLVTKKILGLNDTDRVIGVLASRFLWQFCNYKSYADENSPNVILYGPPGTGKTHAIKKSLDFLCQGDRSKYEFVQFHPSFTYEDFIEGIKPKGVTDNGNIKFELVDGIFKRFCKRAKDNLDKDYYFVVDEINRANLSSVFGETLLCIEKDYRHDGINDENLIKTQYSALIEDMIKENSENESLAYHLVENNAYFGVPKNVFFIGMMNDVDKSIDAFDLALRRRFKWIRKDCDYEVIENDVKFRNGDDFHNIEKYSKSCKNLNDFISEELGMGKSYEFGHSFFMKITDIASSRTISSKNLKVLFNLHLKPTLKEYLRSMFAESQLENKLEEALTVFINPISK
ncbi:McrB family protein [Mariniflexile ostreae]|uniref:McrB family protein n=1 Tax=Mariniflexile ostreae TaxID=1520892 RepID=A0ABV5FB96_9FLAO